MGLADAKINDSETITHPLPRGGTDLTPDGCKRSPLLSCKRDAGPCKVWCIKLQYPSLTMNEVASVSDLFRRAQELRQQNPGASYKDIKTQLVKQFSGAPFPSLHNLTIPEQDSRAPEEDWSAGLPIIRRDRLVKRVELSEDARRIGLCERSCEYESS